MDIQVGKMEKNETKTRRIAHNTVLLFCRMFFLMLINFLAVRFVLKGLGAEDYGLFNTVAGVVTATTFLCSILALSIQRFYSVALGKADTNCFSQIYSASINMVLASSLLCILIFETLGLWFVETQLTIPPQKLSTVICIFHIGLFTFICSLLQIPFTAAIFAKEDMGVYSIISTIECIGKLAVAYMIGLGNYNRLIFYSSGLLSISIIILIVYIVTSKRFYKECKYTTHIQPTLYRDILSFSGWTTFGSVANTGITQGSIILLNIFFGPIANVAFGIALQINNAFAAFSNAMVLPFRPAMIKAYTEGINEYVYRLFTINSKLILFSLLSISIPIMVEMELIQILWLGQSSEEMVVFSRLMIVYIILITIHNPITIIIHATGSIKKYHLIVDGLMLLCFPTTWLLYKSGLPAYTVFYSMIGFVILAHLVRLILLKDVFHELSIKKYTISLILPSIVIILVCSAISYLLCIEITKNVLRTVISCLLIPIAGLTTAYFSGLNSKEKNALILFVKTAILRRT